MLVGYTKKDTFAFSNFKMDNAKCNFVFVLLVASPPLLLWESRTGHEEGREENEEEQQGLGEEKKREWAEGVTNSFKACALMHRRAQSHPARHPVNNR